MAPDAAELLAHSDGAFVGTLIDEPGPLIGVGSSADMVPYVFEVDVAYKGEISNPITVKSARSSASCGLAMGLGQQAAIFVDRDGGEWTGSLCATMGPEALLDGPFEPIPLVESAPNAETQVARWAVLGVGVIAGVALGVTYLRKRPAQP